MTFTGFAEFCFCSRAVLHNLRLEVLSGLLLLKIWRHQLLWVVWQWVRQQTTRSWSLVTLSLLWPSARNYTFYCHTEAWTSARRHYENFGFVGKRNMRIIRSMKPFLMKNCVWHYQFDCMEMKGEAPWLNSYWFFFCHHGPWHAFFVFFCWNWGKKNTHYDHELGAYTGWWYFEDVGGPRRITRSSATTEFCWPSWSHEIFVFLCAEGNLYRWWWSPSSCPSTHCVWLSGCFVWWNSGGLSRWANSYQACLLSHKRWLALADWGRAFVQTLSKSCQEGTRCESKCRTVSFLLCWHTGHSL